ncbi:MAG: zf-HC2 domain-containing protein [Vulcanimicrobiaceae bacterium]
MTGHLNEDAELYALGMLDESERLAVERHVAGCPECAQRIARAQAAGASLAASLPAATPSAELGRRLSAATQPVKEMRLRPSPIGRYAIAAAIAIALLGLAWQTIALRARLDDQDLALVTIVHSHFNHVSMTPNPVDPVAAKILYARDGSWVYVIADRPGGTVHAMATSPAGTTDLGALAPTGQTATLLAHPTQRIRTIVLERNGSAVASAILKY